MSVEQVALLAQKNTLPEPTLDLTSVAPSGSTFRPPTVTSPSLRRPQAQATSPAPAYSETDPWNTNSNPPNAANIPRIPAGAFESGFGSGGAPSTISGGLGKDWWKRQYQISISILPEKQGFILNRYTVYQIHSDVSTPSNITDFLGQVLTVCWRTAWCASIPTILRVCISVGLPHSEIPLSTVAKFTA